MSDAANIELSVSDPAELRSLTEWLGWVPDVTVARVAGEPGPGELGALDVLTVVAGSSALLAAVRMLPEFLRARRSMLEIDMTVKGRKFKVTATNVDDVLPVLERLLDD